MSLATEIQKHSQGATGTVGARTETGPGANGDRVSGILRRLTSTASRLGPIGAVAVLALAAAAALWPGLLTGLDPLTGNPAERLLPPSADHLFGTDQLGRDVFARTVHGSAQTLSASLIAVLIGVGAGVLIGLVSGFFTRAVDAIFMRTVDVLQAVPGLLLSMAVITALGFGTLNVALAVGVAAVPSFARLTRAEVSRWRTTEFVRAARADGLSAAAVLARHVLPQVRGPILALVALEFGSAVLAVSALSFLGFGAPPPQPEWGLLVSEGRDFLAAAWWMTTLPGLVVAAVVLAANRVSHAVNSEREFR
ncbi:ABC transporter permease [Brevibacterium sp. SMBL_HHYL_HB1]|uniref:ABC transporter permease n=1 Tax=Brevibacterium sp. SMBL_HHYL_HB1 TaxID=2777556 RepID=UPI001BA56ACB|nr:ABC transporter permease [Brevibacterium sp. SMBL_HHYL_HB1]QUL79220.1 ABC transporter permease [Brevibacterium sp. SMBL_HHYL_HB1]